jgi:Cu2+-exporting ATPase
MIVSDVKTSCTHCGLPVPKGLIQPDQSDQFCCQGCQTAYQLIHSSGLDAFYRMVDSTGEQQTLQKRTAPEAEFRSFDESTFLEKFSRGLPGGVMEASLGLDGIHCAACVWLVEKLPIVAPGVNEAQVNWTRGSVRVRWHPDQIQLSRIAAVLFQLGYRPYPSRASEKSRRREEENRRHLVRIGIAAAAAGNNMLIAASLYLGMFSYMSLGMEWMLRVASCVVGLVAFFGPGRVFIRGAVGALRTWTPHMDLPIALGLTAGTVAGLVNTVRGTGEIYFDSLTVLIFLLLVGRWIQFRQQNRAADAIELLYRLTPQRTRRVVEDRVEEVAVEDIAVGETVEIRPGDMIPVDAQIVEGKSTIDEAILSGESKPATRTIGDEVAAGTKNLTSVLRAKATAIGQQTRISRIVELVEKAANDKPEIVQWANRIGGYFVLTVISLAIATFLIWSAVDAGLAVDRSIALLIVACPCALALATPLAISVALGRMAKRKIMVKSGDVMQSLYHPGKIWLDKTGTLTEGKMQIVRWHGDSNWIRRVSQIESKVIHPIADAFVEYAGVVVGDVDDSHQACDETASEVETRSGGVAGDIGGQRLLIGNRELMETNGVPFDENWKTLEQQMLTEKLSPCWVAADGILVGLAGIGDRIRPESKQLVDHLKQRDWKVGVLSGDHAEIVSAVADSLGIAESFSGVTPEEKLRIIQEGVDRGETIVMVGDGVNDSAALASATVGIAVHNGAEASLAAAPVYLGRSGLEAINELLESSRTTCRTIRWNFAASLGYNIVGASLAMAGLINPLVAAILMPISSLTVIALSLQAGKTESGDQTTND